MITQSIWSREYVNQVPVVIYHYASCTFPLLFIQNTTRLNLKVNVCITKILEPILHWQWCPYRHIKLGIFIFRHLALFFYHLLFFSWEMYPFIFSNNHYSKSITGLLNASTPSSLLINSNTKNRASKWDSVAFVFSACKFKL